MDTNNNYYYICIEQTVITLLKQQIMKTQIENSIFLALLNNALFHCSEDGSSELTMEHGAYTANFYDKNEDVMNPEIIEEDFGYVNENYDWIQLIPTAAQMEMVRKIYDEKLDEAYAEMERKKEVEANVERVREEYRQLMLLFSMEF